MDEERMDAAPVDAGAAAPADDAAPEAHELTKLEKLEAKMAHMKRLIAIERKKESDKKRREHIESVVKCNKAPRYIGDGSCLAYMYRRIEFGEELTLEYVPSTEKPRVAQTRRQTLELKGIFRAGLHKRLVVVDLCGNEAVVGGILAVPEGAVDKQTLYPRVPDPAGVAGEVEPLRIDVHASQTGLENRKLIFAQLRCLVDGYDVVFLTLIAKGVARGRAEAESYAASVGQ